VGIGLASSILKRRRTHRPIGAQVKGEDAPVQFVGIGNLDTCSRAQ